MKNYLKELTNIRGEMEQCISSREYGLLKPLAIRYQEAALSAVKNRQYDALAQYDAKLEVLSSQMMNILDEHADGGFSLNDCQAICDSLPMSYGLATSALSSGFPPNMVVDALLQQAYLEKEHGLIHSLMSVLIYQSKHQAERLAHFFMKMPDSDFFRRSAEVVASIGVMAEISAPSQAFKESLEGKQAMIDSLLDNDWANIFDFSLREVARLKENGCDEIAGLLAERGRLHYSKENDCTFDPDYLNEFVQSGITLSTERLKTLACANPTDLTFVIYLALSGMAPPLSAIIRTQDTRQFQRDSTLVALEEAWNLFPDKSHLNARFEDAFARLMPILTCDDDAIEALANSSLPKELILKASRLQAEKGRFLDSALGL